jgi:S1-C subfamily serine protease
MPSADLDAESGPRRATTVHALLFAVALGLPGCGGPIGTSRDALEPLRLTYPYPIETDVIFPDLREVAARNAGVYVRVAVFSAADPSGAHTGNAPGLVNAASGIIVDGRGLVVTAAHIALSTALSAEVVTADGRSRRARILRIDPGRELAVLKLDPFPGMQVARLADSSRVRPGEPAFAIGTPGNRRGVVSVGRVLRPHLAARIAYPPYGFDDAVELAMEVEPGHSGGPVLNARGELVGMVASFVLGDVGKVPYASPRITHAVPASGIAAFLNALNGP